MRNAIMVLFGVMAVCQCFAQVSAEEQKFMKENPSGKDLFGMTFDEQQQFQLVQEMMKVLPETKDTFEMAKSKFDTLSAMKDRVAELSAEAKEQYEKEFSEAKVKFEKAKGALDKLEAILTPENIAEYERQKKAYDQKKKVTEDEKKSEEQKAKKEKEAQAVKEKKAKEACEALRWETVSKDASLVAKLCMVKIPGKDYLVGKTEVTQEQWEMVMGNNPAHYKGGHRPVENVSWNDCQAFIEKLNAAPAVKSAKLRFRLPTEAEWEFACRAGGKGNWGKRANGEEGPPDVMGWFCGSEREIRQTHPVARKEPNAFGLYDMHGNVCEFCQDITLMADIDEWCVVCRGGSVRSRHGDKHEQYVYGLDKRYEVYGFRLVALPEGVTQVEIPDKQFQIVHKQMMLLPKSKESFEQAKSKFETLSAMKDRASELSVEAKEQYEKEYAEAKVRFEKAKAGLDHLEAILTPENIAEYERKKKAMEEEKKANVEKEKAEREVQALKEKKAKEACEALRWETVSEDVSLVTKLCMVKIPNKDYLIGMTEVTQSQWELVMGNNPAHFKGGNRPVESVSWNDCQAFVEKLNSAPVVKSAKLRFRLPTKEEWEFACRAGGKGDWGKRANGEEGPLDAMGWYSGNSGSETHPVAQKEPNAFGLYDMHGNVWEWCHYVDGPSRSMCGGCCINSFNVSGAKCERVGGPDERANGVGFRLAALPESVMQAEEKESAEKKRIEEERVVIAKRVAEESQKKAAAAREELAGWPYGSINVDEMKLSVHGTNTLDLYALCSKECHVVFMLPGVTEAEFESGTGKCLIRNDIISVSVTRTGLRPCAATCERWSKYDETGRLVKSGERDRFAEFAWMTNQHAVISARLREAWAKKHGLTLEQAENRVKDLIETIEQSPKGTLRGGLLAARRQMRAQQEATAAAREAERQARAEAAQREAERAEQRIQEELKRVREAKAAEKE